jgi:acyl-CoA synthetase (AMP-forming)/AMP-acid ligase II
MRYEDIKDWKEQGFKRLTGVKPETFKKMLAVLDQELPSFGRPPKLNRADQLLMTLMYWREYRTQFHIAGSYGISEATVCRTINKVEDALAHSGKFHLPSKKALQLSETIIEVVLVDASEQPVEHPKKSKNSTTAAKRSVTPRRHR